MESTFEAVWAFLQDRWLLVAGVLIILVVVIKVVKALVKWFIVLAIIAALLIYGSNYVDDFKQLSDQVKAQVMVEVNEGKRGSDEVRITYKGITIPLKLDETVELIIAQAQKKS